MSLTVRQRVLALVLTAVGGAAWWHQYGQAPEETPPKVVRERRPDYTVDGVSATAMDEAGRPARRLTADQLRHYPDDDSSELDRPALVLYRSEGPPWDIRSETGWVSGDGERVLLHGRVVADLAASAENRAIHLATSELLVRPRQDYAETSEPVALTSGDDWLTSTGMQAWYAETAMRVKFLGRARGRFAVQ